MSLKNDYTQCLLVKQAKGGEVATLTTAAVVCAALVDNDRQTLAWNIVAHAHTS